MRLKKLKKKYFDIGNVCVCGLRGRGKDILFGNIIARNINEYVSNLDYTHDERYHLFNINDFDLGKNTYKNFINYKLNYYKWKFPYNTDLYISDAGIYFPSQYCAELNRDYRYFPNYMALSRQVSHNNVHFNVQNLNRVWDKIREQSDFYIMCNFCKVLLGVVFMKITLYDRYDSCVKRVRPCRVKVPLFAKREVKMNYKMHIDKFIENNGLVRSHFLIFVNKSKHDTYMFEKLLESGVLYEKN